MKFNLVAITGAAMLALTSMGCNQGLQRSQFPTGSQSMAQSSDYQRVYVANTDAGSVGVVDPVSGAVTTVDVGASPTRVARAGDLVFVTLRGEGAVAVLRESGDGLVVEGRVEVGPDPVGVVASEDGRLVFVAVGMADEIVQIDPSSLQIVRRFSVPDQPRWLALHPSGRTLYAGSAYRGTWSEIDLDTDEVQVHALPERERFVFDRGDEGEQVVTMATRVTGDLSVSPDGDRLIIPSLYLDNITPVGEPGDNDDGSGYSSVNGGIGRVNPAITIYTVGGGGGPSLESAKTVFASVGMERLDSDGQLQFEQVRSFISSTVVAPDGMVVLATMEGSEAIVALPLHVESKANNGDRFGMDGFGDGGLGEFDARSLVGVATSFGPRGVVFLDSERAFVDSWMSHSVAEVPYKRTRDVLKSFIVGEQFREPMFEDLQADIGFEVVGSSLPAELEVGRRMFFRATDNRMAAHSGGISCSTCHLDGRNDGITWTFEKNGELVQLQTPSLVGNVSATAPVTWTDTVPTVAAEVRITSSGRMGGSGVSILESEDVAAFVDSTPYPAAPVDANDPAALRGKAIFEGSGECSTCHNGELYTDSNTYAMFGLDVVRTPTLRGVAATAPYAHDGSAPNLEALVAMAENRQMGKTNHLNEQERSDLVAFLKSL